MPTTLVTYALTTRQKVKDLLGITDTNSDVIIDALINYNSMWVQSYLGGRNLLNQSYTEVYDTRKGSQKIFLRQRPVTSTQSSMIVNYRSGTPVTPLWNLYDPNAYLLYAPEGYIHFYGYLPKVHQGLQIIYSAGYLIDFTNEFSATHTLPEDLTWAVTQLVARDYNMRNSQGILSVSTEGQSIEYSNKTKLVDNDLRSILDSYKTPHFAV